MRGSIQKKGKQWYAVVYDGVNPQTGKYIRRWVPAGTRRFQAVGAGNSIGPASRTLPGSWP